MSTPEQSLVCAKYENSFFLSPGIFERGKQQRQSKNGTVRVFVSFSPFPTIPTANAQFAKFYFLSLMHRVGSYVYLFIGKTFTHFCSRHLASSAFFFLFHFFSQTKRICEFAVEGPDSSVHNRRCCCCAGREIPMAAKLCIYSHWHLSDKHISQIFIRLHEIKKRLLMKKQRYATRGVSSYTTWLLRCATRF